MELIEKDDDATLTLPLPQRSTPLALIDSDTLETYIQAATSENTRRAYRQDVQHFIAWGGLLPASADTIVRYLHDHAKTLNPRTLSRRLTAFKHWHTYQGFPDPTSHPLIRKTLTGIQNVHGCPKEKAPAMTLEHVSLLVRHLQQHNTLHAWRNNALLQVGFLGAFRRSELAQMQWGHITFVPEGMEILIPRSKTDQSGKGQICAIPYGDKALCAVKALKTWREKTAIESDFIFRAISRHGRIGHLPLTPDGISLIIKSIAMASQLPQGEKMSGHSLRRGFATETSRQGASFVSIMRHGRWRHEKTVLGYIEEGQRFVENAASLLFKKESPTTEQVTRIEPNEKGL